MLCNRIDNTGSDVAGIAIGLRLMLVDRLVSASEVEQLAAMADDMTDIATELNDVSHDVRYVQQVLRIGRKRTPDRHLRDAIRELDEVRTCRKEKAATLSEKAA